MMFRWSSEIVDRVAPSLPGWIYLVGGAALIAMACLTPAWIQTQHLQWQRGVLQVRGDWVKQYRDRCRQVYDALASDDPVVLQQLAYRQMHLKPVGSHVMTVTDLHHAPTPKPNPVDGWINDDGITINPASFIPWAPDLPGPAPVMSIDPDQMLAADDPAMGAYTHDPTQRWRQSAMVRLTCASTTRLVWMVLGGVFLIAGLWSNPADRPIDESNR